MSEAARESFLHLAGRDGEIDAYELRDILNKVFLGDFNFDEFSIDMARSIVAVYDFDLSGKLGFDDFMKLWSDLSKCKKAFQLLDSDDTGCFNSSEFERAISALDITVSETGLQAMMIRFSDREGSVKFDDFVNCYMRLKLMQNTFENKAVDGAAEFGLDEYVQLCIYS